MRTTPRSRILRALAFGARAAIRAIGAIGALGAIGASCARDQEPPSDPALAATAASARPWFEESAAARGLVFRHRSGAVGGYLFPETVCGGAALFDMDGDGDLDAFLVQGGALEGARDPSTTHALFENRGDGYFTDITAASGVAVGGYGIGAAAADYDDDGDVDLYVCGYGQDLLLENDGGGSFHDVARAKGIVEDELGASAAFVDYDQDGDLDLFVVNYLDWKPGIEVACFTSAGERTYCNPRQYDAASAALLFRNRGDGTFEDVTLESGIGSARGNGLGVACADFDGDGRVDFFVANDGTPNHLWLNQGRGKFEERALIWGCAVDRNGVTRSGMGTDVADLDDDGDWDLIVCNLAGEQDGLFENAGRWFEDRVGQSGLSQLSAPFTRFGVGFADFDLDGLDDLFQANGRVTKFDPRDPNDPYAESSLLMRGTRAWRFEEVRPRGGTLAPGVRTARGAAFGDVDGDGRVDILIVDRDGPARLLHNVVDAPGHWMRIRALEGRGRDALGAVVAIECDGRVRRRLVKSGGSYASSSDPAAHFGLGGQAGPVAVAVTWPDGARESFGKQSVDRTLVLQKGKGVR